MLDELPNIFERFFRAESAKRSSIGGYGLGLAIARKIADGHHAIIGVSSGSKTGTVFSVVFNANTSLIASEAARSDTPERRALAI